MSRVSHHDRLRAWLLFVCAAALSLVLAWSLVQPASGAYAESPPDPLIQEIINSVDQASLMDWNAGLSGEHPVIVGGQPYTMSTRYTRAPVAIAKAWEYTYEQFGQQGFTPSYHDYTWSTYNLKNVVGNKPGTLDPSRLFLLTAHLDDTSNNPNVYAPGADDNASGTAALFEAARILQQYPTDYTIRLVAFTAEEQGLWGSYYYAQMARNQNHDIRGVLNADMIAWDSDNDGEGEIHSGTRADSNAIADVFFDTVATYNIPLVLTRYTSGATTASDHASFWQYQYPALLGIEQYYGDFNAYYHTTNDRQNCGGYNPCGFNAAYYTAWTKAFVGTLARLAGVHPITTGTVTPTAQATSTYTPVPPTATWTPVPTGTPTATVIPPTETPLASTETPVPPTVTVAPPTATVTPCSATFSDVEPGSTFYEYIHGLACMGAIAGYPDGTFRPLNNTTRGQVAKIVVLAEGWALVATQQPTFTDVPQGHTFYAFVETLYEHGAVNGYPDGTYRPQNDVTRGQIAKIVVLSEGWTPFTPPTPTFIDVPAGHAFYAYVETAHQHAIIQGYSDGTYRPANPATRGQLSKIVYEAVTEP
jgi:hypothetical protein